MDSDSWGPIKQPYVASADFQDQFVGVSFTPLKFGILAILVLFSHLWWFQWKFLETYSIDTTERNLFSEFFVHIFLQERGFLLEKRGFDTFEVINHAILDLLGHGIQILITRLIGPSEESTLNFFQNFSSIPFSRNDFYSSKNATWARKTVTKNAISGLLIHR